MRAKRACLVAFADAVWNVAPAWAQPAGTTPEALDALALLEGACERASAVEPQLPEIKSMLARAGRRSVTLARTPELEARGAPFDFQLAQAEATPPAGNPNNGTPFPGVSPTPALGRPPLGPSVIAPP